MHRITISLEASLVRLAKAEVAAGRAPSVSAWIANAVRAKVQARAELMADFEELEARDPTTPDVIATVARSLGLSRAAVAKAIKPRRSRSGTRRAA